MSGREFSEGVDRNQGAPCIGFDPEVCLDDSTSLCGGKGGYWLVFSLRIGGSLGNTVQFGDVVEYFWRRSLLTIGEFTCIKNRLCLPDFLLSAGKAFDLFGLPGKGLFSC